MSKPVFKDVFSFSVRRNRKSYLLYELAWWPTVFYAYQICIRLPSAFAVLMAFSLGSALVWSKIAVTIQRANDISIPKAIWIGLAVPFIGQILEMVLLFMPGDEGSNRSGENPLLGASR